VAHLRAAGDAVEIISLPWRNYAAHLTDNFSGAVARQLQGNFDLLLEDELNHPSLFLINRRVKTAPIVSIVHHLRCSEERPGWQNAFYQLVERRYLRSVVGFVFNSRATKTTVETLVGKALPSETAYPAGDRPGLDITADQIRQRAIHPGPLRILFVGNVIPRKGLDTLLDALAQVTAEWELTVAGSLTVDQTYAERIAGRVAQQFPERVRLLGAVTDTQITDLYLSHDVLAVPSSYEGFGIVYLEGMGAGLPAIASTAGGAAEVITQGQDGYLIAPGDSVALANYIEGLAKDRALLMQLSLAARARFERQASWQSSMGTIRKFLLGMLNQ
jgi:glycosyltransferase involved in cell wall biosynthesis